MNEPVSIRVDAKTQPNLRKLARALIALAQKRLEAQTTGQQPGPGDGS